MDTTETQKLFKACGFGEVNENEVHDIEKIIEWQNVLKTVDINGIEPMYNTLGNDAVAITNNDTAIDARDDIFSNAPEKDDNFFLVPKVVNKK